jgi:hypothetical protein
VVRRFSTVAYAHLAKRDDTWFWVVDRCPFCARRHVHGGGLVGVGDPRRMLGHQLAHCAGRTADGRADDGYVLMEEREWRK